MYINKKATTQERIGHKAQVGILQKKEMAHKHEKMSSLTSNQETHTETINSSF